MKAHTCSACGMQARLREQGACLLEDARGLSLLWARAVVFWKSMWRQWRCDGGLALAWQGLWPQAGHVGSD